MSIRKVCDGCGVEASREAPSDSWVSVATHFYERADFCTVACCAKYVGTIVADKPPQDSRPLAGRFEVDAPKTSS